MSLERRDVRRNYRLVKHFFNSDDRKAEEKNVQMGIKQAETRGEA